MNREWELLYSHINPIELPCMVSEYFFLWEVGNSVEITWKWDGI